MPPTTRTLPTGPVRGATVAEQNDRFRSTLGTDPAVPGRMVATPGVAAPSIGAGLKALRAVQAFAEFTADNDPFGLRDFGAFEVEVRTVRLHWKIDLYEFGSDAPDDPARIRRLLTILPTSGERGRGRASRAPSLPALPGRSPQGGPPPLHSVAP